MELSLQVWTPQQGQNEGEASEASEASRAYFSQCPALGGRAPETKCLPAQPESSTLHSEELRRAERRNKGRAGRHLPGTLHLLSPASVVVSLDERLPLAFSFSERNYRYELRENQIQCAFPSYVSFKVDGK